MAELRDLEEKHPEVRRKDSPTQTVGWKPDPRFKKVRHQIPMLSLDFRYSADDVRKFDETIRKKLQVDGVEYSAEPKFDGAAVSLVYEDGTLRQGATRGDGHVGEDVTRNLLTIPSIPKELANIQKHVSFEVRGEVVLFKADLLELRRQQEELGEDQSPNPRNAASGSLRQLDSSVTASRRLHFFAYSADPDPTGTWRKHSDCLSFLQNTGFLVAEERKVVAGIEKAIEYFDHIAAIREDLAYEIDGVVFKVNNLQHQRSLGFRPREPVFAIARKFPPQRKEAKIIDIVFQVGRTGAITPVAKLERVFVGGVWVENATLHNEGQVREKDIHVNDTVIVQRAGDVIPEVVEVVRAKRPRNARPFAMPVECPECHSSIVKLEGEAVSRCTGGLQCPAQLQQALLHFASRRAMNINGLGDQLVAVLTRRVGVKEPADLYRLGQRVWQWLTSTRGSAPLEDIFGTPGQSAALFSSLLQMIEKDGLAAHSLFSSLAAWRSRKGSEIDHNAAVILNTLALSACPRTLGNEGSQRRVPRLGERDAIKLEKEIAKSKSPTLARFLLALGIRHVGEEIARLLAKESGSTESFLARDWLKVIEEKKAAKKENERRRRKGKELMPEPLRGIGEEILGSIHAFLSEPRNELAVRHLLDAGVSPKPDAFGKTPGKGPLSGKKFALTGTLESLQRAEAEERIRKLGGEIASSISKSVTYLVTGMGPKSKLGKAKELGIEVIDEETFLKLIDYGRS